MNKKKLTPDTVEEIAQRLQQPYWGIQTQLAQEYGVSRNTIQRIQNGTYYKD